MIKFDSLKYSISMKNGSYHDQFKTAWVPCEGNLIFRRIVRIRYVTMMKIPRYYILIIGHVDKFIYLHEYIITIYIIIFTSSSCNILYKI